MFAISRAGFSLCLLNIIPTTSLAMSPQELCERVFEQYGVRAEECDLEPSTEPQRTETEISDVFRESHIFFPKGGAALDDDARLQLSVLVRVLDTPLMSRACLRLVGHSDTTGSSARNLDISAQRADVVAAVLRAGLSDPDRVRDISSEGENRPLGGIPGESPFNRRVEIQARDCP